VDVARILLSETSPTTTLHRHIARYHPELKDNEEQYYLMGTSGSNVNEKVRISRYESNLWFNTCTNHIIHSTQQKIGLFQRMIACFIVVNDIPLSIVEDWAFRQLFLLWKPNLKFPGRKGIQNLILREFIDEKEKITDFFNSRPDLKV